MNKFLNENLSPLKWWIIKDHQIICRGKMGCVDPDQRHDDYLSEIVCDFDRTRGMIHTTEPELVLDRFYARLKLDELTSRLRYNIAWYENGGLISDAYKEAKKRVESFNAIN